MLVQQTLAQDAIFKTINTHLYEKYGVYFAKPSSNWYKDLGLSDFQWTESRELRKHRWFMQCYIC